MNIGKVLLELQPYLVPIKDIFTIISLIVAAAVAISGLNAWQKQLRGTQAYDLAKRILTNVYTMRDGLKLSGFPFSTIEADQAKQETKIETDANDPRNEVKTLDAVIQVRWKKIEEAQRKLEVEALEAEALWGQEAKIAIIDMCQMAKARRNLFAEYINGMYAKEPSTNLDPHLDILQKMVLWNPEHFEGNDFLQQLTVITNMIEKNVFPFLTKNASKVRSNLKLPKINWRKQKNIK